MGDRCERRVRTLGNLVNEVPCDGKLTKSQLVVIPVIQHVQQIRVEGVDVIHLLSQRLPHHHVSRFWCQAVAEIQSRRAKELWRCKREGTTGCQVD